MRYKHNPGVCCFCIYIIDLLITLDNDVVSGLQGAWCSVGLTAGGTGLPGLAVTAYI